MPKKHLLEILFWPNIQELAKNSGRVLHVAAQNPSLSSTLIDAAFSGSTEAVKFPAATCTSTHSLYLPALQA
ncbi:MAG: hypothetical protein CVT93_07095 [Bacteroidetes bacterium HGW-Bacteroidetes-10]|nr:MAG: hypothetical protein CVT93_07095 [Bacteroidetes bacterium HGW-Bacteroidetes-10]